MRKTSPVRFGRATVLVIFFSCCGPQVASAVDFTIYDNDLSLRGDNFQSHNQKIVWTQNGLFRSGDLDWPSSGNTVVVQRSTDGGATWQNVFDTGIHRNDTRPSTVEADSRGNVYVTYPDSGGTRFVKLGASNNYSSPLVNKTYSQATSAAKFASVYDPGQNRIYHATQWGHLLTIDANNGNLIGSRQLFTTGSTGSGPAYPHLFVDEFGVIHHAVTTHDDADDVPYETIRYVKSLDGGDTWRTMSGQALSTPTTSNPNGPSTVITRSNEVNYATWLANMHVKDGKVHFTYQTDNPWDPAGAGNPSPITPYMNYMRFDEATGAREIDRTSFSGGSLSINADSASFASDIANSTGALYVVGISPDGHRLRALVSYDNGENWQDYAQSGSYSKIANPGMARAANPDGTIVGAIASSSPYWATLNHVELPAAQPTTTIAYWNGGGSWSNWNTGGNWVGDVAPNFNDKLAVAIGSASSTAKFDTMRIENNLTVRALIFGTYADADVNLRLHDSSTNGRTLTFASNVPGGSAEINVHHDATADIDIGAGVAAGNVVLGDPLRVNHNGSGFLTISRPISGNHTISKYGDGEFQLTANNSGFTGTLDIREGKLALAGVDSENGQPDVHVASGATLSLGGGFIGETATIGNLSGAGKIDPQFNSGSGTRTLEVNQTTDGTFSGTLQDATSGGRVLALVKNGSGTLTLTGANTYTGSTTIDGGTLAVAPAGFITLTSKAYEINGATLKFVSPNRLDLANGTSITFGAGGGTLDFTGSNAWGGVAMVPGPIALIANGNSSVISSTGIGLNTHTHQLTVNTAAGASLTVSAPLSNSGSVLKTGPGTLILTAANTYTGTTTVDAGTLQVDGSIAASSMTTVADGSVLGGNGAIGPLTLQGGTVAPGASVGTLSAGNTVWTDGSSLLFEIDDATGTAGAAGGPGWDLLDVAGTLDLSGLSTGGFTIDIKTLLPGGGTTPGEMANFLAGNNYSWEFVRTNGGILGAFEAGDFLLDTSAVANPFSGNFGVRQDVDSLFVTYSAASAAVPEPSTLVLIATGLLWLAFYYWRKRR